MANKKDCFCAVLLSVRYQSREKKWYFFEICHSLAGRLTTTTVGLGGSSRVARYIVPTGYERRVYIMLSSPSRKEKGKTVTIYRMPFRDAVKRMRATFGSNPPAQEAEQQGVHGRGRPALGIKRVYVPMVQAIPTQGKTPWNRKGHRGRSVHVTAYGCGINEARKRINCLGTIVI
jgi:hypothetical protein